MFRASRPHAPASWVSYGDGEAIHLAIVLLVLAGGFAMSGKRLRARSGLAARRHCRRFAFHARDRVLLLRGAGMLWCLPSGLCSGSPSGGIAPAERHCEASLLRSDDHAVCRTGGSGHTVRSQA